MQLEMHFEYQVQLVIPDVMKAAVGIPDALHIVLRILDVLDADEFYQSLQTLQTSMNHPVAGLGLWRGGFFPDVVARFFFFLFSIYRLCKSAGPGIN